MLLKTVQIKNYKCILDSTEFPIDQLTCLVGKNESGKSAVLQALYKLHPVDKTEKYTALYDYPKAYLTDFESGERKENNIIVISKWQVTDSELKEIEKTWGTILKTHEIIITSKYDNNRAWDISFDFDSLFRKKVESCGFTSADFAHFPDLTTLDAVANSVKDISTPSEPEKLFINWFKDSFKHNDISIFAEQEFLKFLPKFMYFSEYQKMPGLVAINTFSSNKEAGTLTANEKVFDALLSLANTSVDEINNSDKLEALINKTRGVSSKVTREIFTYWSQNRHLKVDFRCDMAKRGDLPPFNVGYIFSTRIENTRHDSTVSFDDRSTGFVWFFSFLIWFNQLQHEHHNLIVLLDEPGLSLHAKAQGDLLRFFKEKITHKFQLIYTTHSPFMLDFSDILSARTVEDVTDENKNVLGTKVGSRVLSKDKDTIFPLQAAFGYDITQTLFIGKNTLVVEGPSDILYLHYFSNYLERKGRKSLSKDWTICPSGGIDKIQSFVSLFNGNALKIASLSDYHDGDRKKITKLKESGILNNERILLASDYANHPTGDIEDIIGGEAYFKLINTCYELKPQLKYQGEYDGKIMKNVDVLLRPLIEARFNHYFPSEYLIRNPDVWSEKEILDSLDRFEKLFIDLNSLLD